MRALPSSVLELPFKIASFGSGPLSTKCVPKIKSGNRRLESHTVGEIQRFGWEKEAYKAKDAEVALAGCCFAVLLFNRPWVQTAGPCLRALFTDPYRKYKPAQPALQDCLRNTR